MGLCVLPASGEDLAQVRSLGRTLLRTFASDPDARVQDLGRLLADLSRPSRPDYLSDLTQGIDALSEGRYGPARRSFTRVLQVMRSRLAGVPEADLAFAELHLAAAELGSGRATAALRLLEGLLVQRPSDTLTLASEGPPGFAELLAEAGRSAAARPRGTLEITSIPEGAEVTVDGRHRGSTPVLIPDLPMGLHVVAVELEGHARQVIEVKVGERSRSVSVPLSPHPQTGQVMTQLFGLRQTQGPARLAGLADLSQRLGLDRLLVVFAAADAGGQSLEAALYDLPRERLLARQALRVSLSPASTELLPLALWRPRRPAPVLRSVPAPPRPAVSQTPWYRRWWVWTLVGAAVAAAVIIPLAAQPDRTDAPNEVLRLTW